MKISDKEIDELIANSQWRKVIENLIEIIQNDNASLHDYTAFVEAVSRGEFEDCYEIAFNCFIKASQIQGVPANILHKLYALTEPIIKRLNFFYFDDKNSKNIPVEFYLRARFMLFITASKYNDAILTINKLIQQKPAPEYYFQRSKIFGMQKKFKFAIEDINTAIKIQPSEFLFYQRALLKQKMRDYKGALFDFDSAINCNSKNFQYYFDRGMLQENMEHYKNASDDFKKVVKLNPGYVEAFQELAWCKYKMQKPQEGLTFINIAMQLDKNNAGSFYIKGCIDNSMKKYGEAILSLSQAILLDNQSDKTYSAKFYHQKAWSEFQLKKYAEAQKDINKAITLNPKNISFYFMAMDIEFFGIKNYYAAQGYAKTILKMDNQNQRAIAALKEINDKIAF